MAFTGRHDESDTDAIIRAFPAECKADPELATRIIAEAASDAETQHESIAQVLDLGEDDNDCAYVATERVEGADLFFRCGSAAACLPLDPGSRGASGGPDVQRGQRSA